MRNSISGLIALTIATLAFLPSEGRAQESDENCSVSVMARPSLWNISIQSDAVMAIDISIEKSGNCRSFLVVDTPSIGMTGRTGSIDALVMRSPWTFSANSISIPIATGDFQLFWRPNTMDGVRAGMFEASLPLRITDDSGNTIDTAFVDLALEVDAELSVMMQGGTGRSMDIDFGNIAVGSERSVVFDVTSNSEFSVETISASGGFLRHTIAGIDIPYEVRISSQGLAGSLGNRRFESGEGSIILDLVVPAVPEAPAGNYADELTVVFRSEL